MTQEQFERACRLTRTLLPERLTPVRSPEDPVHPNHLMFMLGCALGFYVDGKAEKANRWLGYVQGVIAAKGWATLDELKRANMPEGEAFDPDKI
jgi:hypothetical protein